MANEPLFTIETGGQLEPFMRREWLLTNGLGAFAMGTVCGCNTRRYHGLLCAATMPPVGRVMALGRIGEILMLGGASATTSTARAPGKGDAPTPPPPPPQFELSINEFGSGNYHPRGDRYLRRFELGDAARWVYDVEGATVTKDVQLLWNRNVAGVRYTVDPGKAGHFRLDLLPFTALRDFHALRHAGDAHFDVRTEDRRAVVHDNRANVDLYVQSDGGRFHHDPDWWYGHYLFVEQERGQDCTEDLFKPGRFTLEANGVASITLWASVEPLSDLPDWGRELYQRAGTRATPAPRAAVAPAARPEPGKKTQPSPPPSNATVSPTVRRLFRAADDFIVFRRAPDGSDGTSVIAGYPWFADWGRDTFISLPGLLLETGRFEQARQVLRTFGEYVSEGMVPNRFDDYSNEPHYNTVDASLWYVHAAYEYLRHSKDRAGFEKDMLPACRKIIDGYRKGTRFDIRMEGDGLITQGNPRTQLTWMDAKMGDTAFTPRQGKAVEINALWYHALVLMGERELAKQVAESFRREFWIDRARGLADVVNGGRQDATVRPNQIFAVSLPNSPLDAEQQRAVVEVVRRDLLTPMGLRTLERGNLLYRGRYGGDQWTRDSAYHNGTVWPWLIGPFLDAYLRVNQRSAEAIAQAKAWLQPLIDHLEQNCIGQIAEICEGDEPHRPVGTPAQAWSVAEVLRLAVVLGM